MKLSIAHFRNVEWILIASAILLSCIGLLFIYSSSLGSGDFSNFNKQWVFLGMGLGLMFVFSAFDYRILRTGPYLILFLYMLAVGALAGLFLFAPEIRGVKGWYKVGPVSVDPIEGAKLILLVLLAKYFSMRHIEVYRIRHIFLSGLYVLIPAFLIFLQPDLGSATLLIALWLSILLISGIKIRHFLLISFIGLLILILSWSFILQDYQKERIISFVAPHFSQDYFEEFLRGPGWSQEQAKIAVGSGGIFGQGIGKGSQTQLGFLTEPKTDFIFAAIAEEIGLFGILVLFGLYSLLFWRIFKIAFFATNNFARIFSAGFATLLAIHIFINIGMNLGLLPVVGISLPLVSYGGSGLIMNFISLGILQSINRH